MTHKNRSGTGSTHDSTRLDDHHPLTEIENKKSKFRLAIRRIVQTKSRVISKNIVRTINKKYSPIFGGTQNMGILGTLISLIYTPPKYFAPQRDK